MTIRSFAWAFKGYCKKHLDVEVVGEAEDGLEVLEILGKTVTDVVLMDIDMGRTSGIETTRKVKQAFPGCAGSCTYNS